jgi:membrane protein YdbS with pleckstrin-like domain
VTYADSLLTDGETVVLRERQHWLAIISRSQLGITLFVLAIIALIAIWWLNIGPGWIRDIPSGVALVVLVLAVILIVYRFIQWRSQEYLVTNRRLLKVGGVLNKHSGDSSLEKINDAILRQSVLGRMLKFGDLEILTAAEQAVDHYQVLNDPIRFKKVMLTQKHQLETGYYPAPPPTPPLRAEAPASAAAPTPTYAPPPAPAAVPAAPAAAPMPAPAAAESAAAAPEAGTAPADAAPEGAADESLEITQTLARLADLRDSGAITPEEYEQKKTELLSRL